MLETWVHGLILSHFPNMYNISLNSASSKCVTSGKFDSISDDAVLMVANALLGNKLDYYNSMFNVDGIALLALSGEPLSLHTLHP